MVRQKKFRADLYYRLNVFPIILPPLRDRKEDIPLLVRCFVEQCNKRFGKGAEEIPHQLLERMIDYHCPGIRELQNFVERAVITSTGSILSPQNSELWLLSLKAQHISPITLADAERAHIERVLVAANWVISGRDGAAARLGLPRTTLISRMQRFNIMKPSTKGSESAGFPVNAFSGSGMETPFAIG